MPEPMGKASPEQPAQHRQQHHQSNLAADALQAEAKQVRTGERLIGKGPVERPGLWCDLLGLTGIDRLPAIRDGIVQVVGPEAKSPRRGISATGRLSSPVRRARSGSRPPRVDPIMGERDLSNMETRCAGDLFQCLALAPCGRVGALPGRSNLDARLEADDAAGHQQSLVFGADQRNRGLIGHRARALSTALARALCCPAIAV